MSDEVGGAIGSTIGSFLPDDVPASTAVVEAVADVTNERPEAMPPLYDAVDTDALDSIFRRTTDGMVAFRYVGFLVSVHADGSVQVLEAD